jgi:hypothetical protein
MSTPHAPLECPFPIPVHNANHPPKINLDYELQLLNIEYEMSTQREAVLYARLFGVDPPFVGPTPLPSMEAMRECIDVQRRNVRSMRDENSVLRSRVKEMMARV